MSSKLQDFMISRTRARMMELFFRNPNQMYYVREITRETKEEINAVRRELKRMGDNGLLLDEQRGNRVYYRLNKTYVFYPELLQMVAKSTGLGAQIRKLRRKLGTLEFVMFSSKFVRGQRPLQDEVDILVIGEVVLPELQALVKDEEDRIGREIKFAVFDKNEFSFRKTRRDPFMMDVMYGNRVMIIGSEDEFVERQVPGI